MKLNATETIFVEGALRHKGEAFDGTKVWDGTRLDSEEPAADEKAVAGAAPAKRPTRKELMERLSAAGIKFNPTDKSADLEALFAANDGNKEEPAADEKGAEGVGNQDVI